MIPVCPLFIYKFTNTAKCLLHLLPYWQSWEWKVLIPILPPLYALLLWFFWRGSLSLSQALRMESARSVQKAGFSHSPRTDCMEEADWYLADYSRHVFYDIIINIEERQRPAIFLSACLCLFLHLSCLKCSAFRML